MKKRILLVDDEQMARDRMKRFLEKVSDVELIEAANAPQALEFIKERKPDIVFLDIQMPQMTGFDLLYQLEERNFQIIFQTAYDEFAVKAFEVNACDYLLKPYTEERFLSALNKAEQNLKQLPSVRQNLEKLEEHLEKAQVYLNNVTSKTGSTTRVIRVQDIYAFKSEDHYTFALTEQGEYIIENSLSFLEKKLNPTHFMRCHRNNIVRLDQIDKIGGQDQSVVILKNGIEFLLSRENKKKVLGRL